MTRTQSIFQDFKDLKVLVVGDVMLDSYVYGKVERVSPEAPVPVIDVDSKEKRLGGAANVALNIKALGAEPILCSILGEDKNGKQLIKLLEASALSAEGMISSPKRRTTEKLRIIGNNHLLLRMDTEDKFDLDQWENEQLLESAARIIPKMDVVIFQDYNKGVLNASNIEQLISLCNEHGIPSAVDPKKLNFLSYKGVTLFKPNLKELKEGLNIDQSLKIEANLKQAEAELRQLINNKYSLITLSEQGVFISDKESSTILPAHVRNISDVSGAGDSVISVAALCLALGLPKEQIANIANLAGGLVCEEVGVVPISKEKLQRETEKIGIF